MICETRNSGNPTGEAYRSLARAERRPRLSWLCCCVGDNAGGGEWGKVGAAEIVTNSATLFMGYALMTFATTKSISFAQSMGINSAA